MTDGDFGVMPTEQALVEFLQSRAIGGGDAKLQVAGAGYFTDYVVAGSEAVLKSNAVYRASSSSHGGIYFGSGNISPCNNVGGATDGLMDLGSNNYRFKDAYFSGSVNFNNVTVHGGRIARFIANPSQSDSIEITFTGMTPPAWS